MFVLASLLPAAAQSNVVGGQQVSEGDWPDTAGIVFSGSSVECTGTLIAPDLVITAGHCLGGITHVLLDTNDYTEGGELIEVKTTLEYPDSWNTVDAAVLVLKKESSVKPRIIAQDCILEDLYNGAPVQIVGYGAIDEWGNRYVSELMEARSEVTDYNCTDLSSGCNKSVSPGGELGAGGDGVDACYGDSGGPLYLLTDKGAYLVGVTSRSYDYVTKPCYEGGIWGRPDYVIDWIEDRTGRTLERPDCDGGGTGSGGVPPAPTADPINVVVGATGRTLVEPNDPDSSSFEFVLIAEPTLGSAVLGQDGILAFEATAKGEETLRVKVTDERSNAEVVEIPVTVVQRSQDDKGTCSAVPAGGSALSLLGLLGLLGLLRRQPR